MVEMSTYGSERARAVNRPGYSRLLTLRPTAFLVSENELAVP